MINRVDRRTFLKLLSMAGGLAISGAPACTPRSGGSRRVVVLGGGLAGLASAWQLMDSGFDVVVIEAQSIPGGRVRTVRDPFKNGGYTEAGALRIPNNHHWTMKYIKLMGLESKLASYNQDTGNHLWYLENKRFVTPKGAWPLDGLSAREKPDPSAMMSTYLGDALKAVGDPTGPEFPTKDALALDAFTLRDYLKKVGASDTWAKFMYASEGELARMNALVLTAFEATPNDGAWTTTYGLVGGNDQLPKAIAAALGSRVKYDTVVLKLAHHDDGVVVTVRDRAGQQEIAADDCICALPFPLLRDVLITPAFSQQKMDAIQQYQLVAAARAVFQTRTRFWRRDPLGPLGGLTMVGTDTLAGRVWNTSQLQPDKTMGMLQSYMFDEHAVAFASLPAADRIAKWTEVVSEFLPDLRNEVVANYAKVWQEDPWAKGAFAFMQPNEFAWIWSAARRPEGRVYFAGEHTSLWPGWQNGALESAERCVSEIKARLPHADVSLRA